MWLIDELVFLVWFVVFFVIVWLCDISYIVVCIDVIKSGMVWGLWSVYSIKETKQKNNMFNIFLQIKNIDGFDIWLIFFQEDEIGQTSVVCSLISTVK